MQYRKTDLNARHPVVYVNSKTPPGTAGSPKQILLREKQMSLLSTIESTCFDTYWVIIRLSTQTFTVFFARVKPHTLHSLLQICKSAVNTRLSRAS